MAGTPDALILQLSADVRGLEKQFAKANKIVDNGSRAMERRAKIANDNIGKAFAGGALSQGIDAFASRAPAAVAGLRGIGVAGTAAAVAVGAVAAAFAGARAAAAYSDELADTADKLHITTDALQEYRYAIRAAGGDEKGADEALENFSATLGKAQAGMSKAQKGFLMLGFTKEQIKGFTDVESTLPRVSEALQGLSDAQRDAAISQLGLGGLKQLLDEGPAGMARLRDEAHKLGLVMDADLIKRGAELNDQFETVARVIDIQLKSALVDLGPVLLGLIKLVADLARAAADVADAFRSIENKTTRGLQERRAQLVGEIEGQFSERLLKGEKLSKPEEDRLKRIGDQIDAIDRQLASRATANAAPPIKPTRSLIDLSSGGSRGPKGPRDSTASREAQVEAAQLAVEQRLLNAWSNLVVGAEQRAEIAKLILDVEREEFQSRVDKQIADIKADEGLSAAKKREFTAALEGVKAEQAKVDALKRELIDRELAEEKARDALSVRQSEYDAQQEMLSLASQMARTAAERRDIELKLLDLSDQRVRAEQEAVIASKTASEADKQIARNKLSALEATRGGREAVVRQGTQGPLESYLDELPGTIGEVNEAFQRMESEGLSSLIDGLAAASVGAADLGDVFRSTIRQMAMDANRILLQSMLSGATGGGGGGLFSSLLSIGASAFTGGFGGTKSLLQTKNLAAFKGFAGGTDSAPGGLSWVGERGPELMNVPRGAQIIPNDILRGLSRSGSGSSRTYSPTMHVNVYPQGQMSAADARRTGSQISAAAMQRFAAARKAGL